MCDNDTEKRFSLNDIYLAWFELFRDTNGQIPALFAVVLEAVVDGEVAGEPADVVIAYCRTKWKKLTDEVKGDG